MGSALNFPRPCPRNEHSDKAWEHWRQLGNPKYVVAPMVDASELAFRDICRRYNAHLAYTPMLHSRTFSTEKKYRHEHFTTHNSDRPVIAQFCANDPATLVTAARHIEDQVDAIDLNLGCPQGIAKRGHYGSFLQDEWGLIYDIVRTAKTELKVPIWVKIRIFDDLDKTLDYACMLQTAGASVIAVHGRTREQKGRNAPLANWDIIKQITQVVTVPVIANGNVRNKQDADNAVKVTGAAAVMSAWALLDNPATFVGEDTSCPSRMRLVYEYLEVAELYKTPLRMVRLHLFKMLRSRLDVNMDLNETVAGCKSFEEFRNVMRVLEQRCDFDGVTFEQRVKSGNVPENVLCERKVERLKRAAALLKQKKDSVATNAT